MHTRQSAPLSSEKRQARWAGLAILAFGLLMLGAPAHATTTEDDCVGKPSNTRAYVTVENMRSDRGQVAITLYPDVPSRFLKRKGSLYVRRVPAHAPRTRLCFLIPAPGIYGIAIYHDENANGKIDRVGIGLPAEGFGFSNNAATTFGIPRFSAIRIRLAAGGETRIRLRYLREDEIRRVNRAVIPPGTIPPR